MKVEIVAEVAQGYEGKPYQAAALISAAAASGADAAKLQLVYASELSVPSYKYHSLFQALEMADSTWMELAELARAKKIDLHLDVFGPRSLALAERVGATAVKVHGTDMANQALLELVARSAIPRVLLSCGGSLRSEIERASTIFAHKNIVLLFGFQGYPTPNAANQIARVRRYARDMAEKKNIAIGFADHAPVDSASRFTLPATAIGAGATLIEKHLTLAQVLRLEDHEAALNPDDFAQFVILMRGCAEAIGVCQSVEDFGMDESEKNYRRQVRKHVVAVSALPAGTVLQPQHLSLKRTPAANAIDEISLAYGRRLTVDVEVDQPLTSEMLAGGDR